MGKNQRQNTGIAANGIIDVADIEKNRWIDTSLQVYASSKVRYWRHVHGGT